MTDKKIRKFVRDRNKTFTNAVLKDDWDAVKAYCRRWNVKLPDNESVMKAGVYKAVQAIAGISKDVKETAAEKCVAMGFKPTMW